MLYVTDLGADEVRRYPVADQMVPLPTVRYGSRTASGRATWPARDRRYVVGKLDGIVRAYDGEKSAGTLTSREFEGVNQPSHLDMDGEFLYVANRGPNTITVLRADDLTLVAEVPSGGEWPRHFAIDGDRLYVANQHSGVVTEFALEDGVPTPTGQVLEVDSPSCVLPALRRTSSQVAGRAGGAGGS